jgi:hypothetical protein
MPQYAYMYTNLLILYWLQARLKPSKPKVVYLCGKGKAVPLQAWSGPEGSKKLRFTTAQDGGKVVSPTHEPHLPPGNFPGTHFC